MHPLTLKLLGHELSNLYPLNVYLFCLKWDSCRSECDAGPSSHCCHEFNNALNPCLSSFYPPNRVSGLVSSIHQRVLAGHLGPCHDHRNECDFQAAAFSN